jgi:hypothetical protein
MVNLFVRIEGLEDYKKTEALSKICKRTTIEKLKSIIRERLNENDEFKRKVFEKYGELFKDKKIILLYNRHIAEETVGKEGTLADFLKKSNNKGNTMLMCLGKIEPSTITSLILVKFISMLSYRVASYFE